MNSEHFSINETFRKRKRGNRKNLYHCIRWPLFEKKNKNNIKPEEAIKHPKWSMGKKISIDSATLMNKIFEIEEARLLFPKFSKKINIIIHPQSLVHAIIQLKKWDK